MSDVRAHLRQSHGFTLVEVVLVLILVTVLAGVGVSTGLDWINQTRYEQTVRDLSMLKSAIVGFDRGLQESSRSQFGYFGDMGNLPSTLADLNTQGAQPLWAYNTTRGFGYGWRGPYVASRATGDMSYLKDAWGRNYVYTPGANPPSLLSYGADGVAGGTVYDKDIVVTFPTALTQATVEGIYATNENRFSGEDVTIYYPANGALTSATTTTNSSGRFSFSNIPFGYRSLVADTVKVPLTVDRGKIVVPLSAFNSRSLASVEALTYVASSAQLWGGVNQGLTDNTITAVLSSTYRSDLEISSITVTAANAETLTGITLNGRQKLFAAPVASGSQQTMPASFIIPANSASNNLKLDFSGSVGGQTITVTFSYVKRTGTDTVTFSATESWGDLCEFETVYQNNLRADWLAACADGVTHYSGANATWEDLTSNDFDGTLSSTVNATWVGSGTGTAPYALNLNGSANVDFGSSPLASQTKMMATAWIQPANVSSTADTVILDNSSNGTGNGFTFRQHSSYRDVVMSMNPVGYWRLGESSGTTATDLGSGGNNGTYTNGPTLVQTGALTSDTDYSVDFDGSNDLISINGISSIDLPGDFSVSAWVRADSLSCAWTECVVAIKRNSATNGANFKLAFQNDGYLSFSMQNTSPTTFSVLSDTTRSTGTWYHLVGTVNSNVLAFYVDGVKQSATATFSGTRATNAVMKIGTNHDSNSFLDGKIDEVTVFDTALTAGQIAALYQAGKRGKQLDFIIGKSYEDEVLADSPYGYWRFGETTGTVAKDYSGRGNNGTYSNVTLGTTGLITGDGDKAGAFNASNSRVTIPSTSDFDMGSSDLSIELWVNGGSSYWGSERMILEHNIWGAADAWQLTTNSSSSLRLNWPAAYAAGKNLDVAVDLADGNRHHIVGTFQNSSTTWIMYYDGVQVGTLNTGMSLPSGSAPVYIGWRGNGTIHFGGTIDEVALYRSVLSAARVTAHYNAGIGSSGGICRSTSGYSGQLWNFVAGIFSGTTAKFFHNGVEECSVSVSSGFTSPATDLHAGATSSNTKNWTGKTSDIKIYATSDGSSPGTASDVKNLFDESADHYRETPVGEIVTSGLVFNLDAGSARDLLRPYPNGCASDHLTWLDLTTSLLNGTLSGFSSCGSSSGWRGDGTAGDPYRLVFDGTDDKVTVTRSSAIEPSSAITISTWLSFGASPANFEIFRKQSPSGSGFDIRVEGGGDLTCYIKTSVSGWVGVPYSESTTGQFMNYACTYDGTNIRLYKNGSQVAISGAMSGTISYDSSDLLIGSASPHDAGYKLNGAIAQASIYSRALSAAEILANCNAQKDRFTGVTCN